MASKRINGRAKRSRGECIDRRCALTLVEILVALIIVALLMAIAIPTVLSVRESSRRSACLSNLHQIGLAVAHYEQVHGQLPPGRDAAEGLDHSWVTLILPQLEQMPIYDRYDFGRPWNDDTASENKTLAETDLKLFLCPSTVHTVRGASDYGGNYGSSLSGLKKGFGIGLAWDSGVLVALHTPSKTASRTSTLNSSHVLDGAAHTFLVMEDSGRTEEQGGQWANGQQCFAHEYPTINEYRQQGIYSDHTQGANVLAVDGRAWTLGIDADPYVIGAYSTRNNGELPDSQEPSAGS